MTLLLFKVSTLRGIVRSKQLNKFDEHLVRQLIKKITIQETYCDVEFQNGDSLKINL